MQQERARLKAVSAELIRLGKVDLGECERTTVVANEDPSDTSKSRVIHFFKVAGHIRRETFLRHLPLERRCSAPQGLAALKRGTLVHLSLQTCAQDISHFLAGQALAFQQRFGQVLDHAPVMVYKIPHSSFQVFKRIIALPFFRVQATQQVYHNIGIAGGTLASDAMGNNHSVLRSSILAFNDVGTVSSSLASVLPNSL